MLNSVCLLYEKNGNVENGISTLKLTINILNWNCTYFIIQRFLNNGFQIKWISHNFMNSIIAGLQKCLFLPYNHCKIKMEELSSKYRNQKNAISAIVYEWHFIKTGRMREVQEFVNVNSHKRVREIDRKYGNQKNQFSGMLSWVKNRREQDR